MVSDRLEQSLQSMGEMQTLANGVGDLKRLLTNVKSRGTWAEVGLGNLLEEMMAPDQYGRNIEIVPGSNQRVEFAIRLPGDGENPVWLPIDAKFPVEDYERLVDASQRAGMSMRSRSRQKASRPLFAAQQRRSVKSIFTRRIRPSSLSYSSRPRVYSRKSFAAPA